MPTDGILCDANGGQFNPKERICLCYRTDSNGAMHVTLVCSVIWYMRNNLVHYNKAHHHADMVLYHSVKSAK